MVFSSKKKICFFSALFLVSFSLLSGQSYANSSKKTALRYLKLAEQYASEKNWSAAESNSALGLAYDESISDLWYIQALSKINSGTKKNQVIPLIQKSLTEGQWVDYNKESARILYADLLCSTGSFTQAQAVLNMPPLLYSADAEFIRAKCYYNSKAEDGIQKAREKIDAARRIYPEDKRFAELFFSHEYSTGGRNSENSLIADAFISAVSNYSQPSAELEILAALFAQGEQKIRMLKSFNARGLKSPLYPSAALECGLISEQKALDYFYSYSDKTINWSILKNFAKHLSSPDTKKEFGEYLNSYNGTILFDTDGDLTCNLYAEYKRGRPQKIKFDSNQDDENEWEAFCDFGVPVSITLQEGNCRLEYDKWPSIHKAVYPGSDGKKDKLVFNLVSETLFWSPFSINAENELLSLFNVEFYIPEISEQKETISGEKLLSACSSYEIPSKERENAEIKVSMLNGQPQLARYFSNGKMYAQTHFKNGLPDFRVVDMDEDGLFETTETYGREKNGLQDYLTQEEEIQIVTNLFGSGSSGTGFYLKMIQLDQNGDTIPDFTEEYSEGKGKTTSWDLNNDGEWELRYIKHPEKQGTPLTEDTIFRRPFFNDYVSVVMENGIPVHILENGKKISVFYDEPYGIFWLGEKGNGMDAEILLKNINQTTVQGVCKLVPAEGKNILCVRIGSYIFGELLPDEKTEEKIQMEDLL